MRPNRFLAEHFCSDCGTPFLNSAPLDANGRCSLCRSGLSGYDAVYTYGEYEGVLRSLIHVFKYGGVMPLASRFGPLLSRALAPRAAVRRDRRHAAALAQETPARLQSIGVISAIGFTSNRDSDCEGAATTQRNGSPGRTDTGATADQCRRRFRSEQARPGAGRHVLLIDDVFTTGATASACSAVLKRAGAKRVSVLTLARADRRKSLARVL